MFTSFTPSAVSNGGQMMQISIVLLISVAAIICGGCQGKEKKEPSMTSEAAFEKAVQYITTNRPEWKESLGLPYKVVDDGDRWMVTFVLPPDQQGGAPVLYVDKQRQEVVEAFHEQ